MFELALSSLADLFSVLIFMEFCENVLVIQDIHNIPL